MGVSDHIYGWFWAYPVFIIILLISGLYLYKHNTNMAKDGNLITNIRSIS